MFGADSEPKSPPKSEDRERARLLDWLDVLAKLTGAVAVVGVAVTANSFQGKMNESIQTNQNRMTGSLCRVSANRQEASYVQRCSAASSNRSSRSRKATSYRSTANNCWLSSWS